MPNAQLKNLNPSVKVASFTPSAKAQSLVVNSNIRNIVVAARVDTASAVTVTVGTSGGGSSFAGKGYLMGMLALPYIAVQTIAGATTMAVTYVGPKPNLRLSNI